MNAAIPASATAPPGRLPVNPAPAGPPLVRCSLARLRAKAARRAPGYLADVLAAAVTVSGDDVRLTLADRDRLRAKYAAIEASLGEPTPLALAANFAHAVTRWAANGFPVVDIDVYRARASACNACPFWDATARAGLGKCRHHACGCTALKPWLATEHCPAGNWTALPMQSS